MQVAGYRSESGTWKPCWPVTGEGRPRVRGGGDSEDRGQKAFFFPQGAPTVTL